MDNRTTDGWTDRWVGGKEERKKVWRSDGYFECSSRTVIYNLAFMLPFKVILRFAVGGGVEKIHCWWPANGRSAFQVFCSSILRDKQRARMIVYRYPINRY